ncbi:MAG: ATP-dependent DNA helicase, partial [Betaproteobacteria bacterium]
MREQLDAVFDRHGPLAAKIPEYRERSQQVEMANRVAGAIRDNAVLVCEAGTGTGKTFAYLVPALLSAGKVILSTGTKTLQDQLYHRDLPTVRTALNVPVTTALLKGRANYVCHYHLERNLAGAGSSSRELVADLQR